jgi:HSP20 family protein
MTLSVKGSAGQAQWRPFREFENLYAEMDRLAQSVFGGLTGDGAWLPAADVVETDSAYVIEVELPGVRREDVDVNLNGNELVVTGEVKERKREGLFRRRTRRVSSGRRHRGVLGAWRADRLCTEGREHQVKQDHCQ